MRAGGEMNQDERATVEMDASAVETTDREAFGKALGSASPDVDGVTREWRTERAEVLIFLFYEVGSQEMLLNGNEILGALFHKGKQENFLKISTVSRMRGKQRRVSQICIFYIKE